MHWVCCACNLASDNAGNKRAARIAIMAMTTNSSISVKPARPSEVAGRHGTGDWFIVGSPSKLGNICRFMTWQLA